MEGKFLSRRWFSSVLLYLISAWSLFCFLGAWFVSLQYGVFKGGLIGMIVTFLFATIIWALPFSALVLVHLYLSSGEKLTPGT